MASAYMQTNSGRMFDLLNPNPEDVCIRDIAHHLSHIIRFTGAVARPYTVAEHSIRVSEMCPNHPLQGLMHDAHEAYIGDCSSPLKRVIGDAYRVIERGVWLAVAVRYNLLVDNPEEVHYADVQMLVAEASGLLPGGTTGDWWKNYADEIPNIDVSRPMTADKARREFLRRFHELTEGKYD